MRGLTEFLDWVQYEWGWAWLAGGVWLFLLIVFILACVTAPYDTEIWGGCKCGAPSSWVIVNANGPETWCGECKGRLG